MTIPADFWNDYASALAELDTRAARDMQKAIDYLGLENTDELVDIAYQIVQKYGSASSELASELYDAIAEVSGVSVPFAEPAEVAGYGQVSSAVRGANKQSLTGAKIPGAVSRLVKQAGADTMLQNAQRDGAWWAWIPVGDTCAFCITLASQGWVHASKRVRGGDHAEHIHGNCDCTFAVKFREEDGVEGYDPEEYLKMYYDAPLDEWNTPDGERPQGYRDKPRTQSEKRINALRRQFYAENRERINAEKRSAYARRRALESSTAEETDV